MVANNKPGVDWPQVREWYAEGVSTRECARRSTELGTKVSHVAVSKRARKEGWAVNGNQALTVQTKHLTDLAEPHTEYLRRIAGARARTPENASAVLERIRAGQSETTAIAGLVSYNCWRAWLKDDPELKQLVEDALRCQAADDEQALVEARDRGDIRATIERLRRNPVTKKQWQEEQPQRTDVQISVVITDAIRAISSKTIEGEATEVEE